MTKKLVIAGIIVVAALWVAKKTHFMSYAATCIAHGKESVRQHIPRDLELARIRNEIKQLDRDYTDLFDPIAEKKVSVKAHRISATARKAIEEKGGTIELLAAAGDDAKTAWKAKRGKGKSMARVIAGKADSKQTSGPMRSPPAEGIAITTWWVPRIPSAGAALPTRVAQPRTDLAGMYSPNGTRRILA